jgi:hypothetical protein
LTQKVAVNNLSETMAGQTSRESLLAAADSEHIRLAYFVDNAYPGGDGLIRMQAVPEKGKHDLTVTLSNSDTAETFKDYQIRPIYMRLKNTGDEVFGNIPRYFPMVGSAGEDFRYDLITDFPLPRLPKETLPIGGKFQSGFQLGDLNLDNIDDSKTVVAQLVAAGELVGVEWQNGHPCARLHKTLGVRDPKTSGSGRLLGAQAIDEDIWFATDLGTVIKMVRTYTIDQKIEAAPATTGGNAGTGASGTRGAPSAPSSAGSAGGGQRGSADWHQGSRGGPAGPQSGGRGGPVAGGAQGGGPTAGGVGQGGGGGLNSGRSGGGASTRVVRLTVQQVFELEK